MGEKRGEREEMGERREERREGNNKYMTRIMHLSTNICYRPAQFVSFVEKALS